MCLGLLIYLLVRAFLYRLACLCLSVCASISASDFVSISVYLSACRLTVYKAGDAGDGQGEHRRGKRGKGDGRGGWERGRMG